jgi:FMN-dependent NADH-azoreductase
MKLLHINASPRGEKSRTLNVSNEFLNVLKESNKNLEITALDLFQIRLPDVYGSAVDAKYALMSGGALEEQSRSTWAEISRLSNEFLRYDAYLISCPMWNFTIPYKLKHYIDVIMQAGILFNFSENGVEGLALNKKMVCITSRGNDYSKNTQMYPFDFQEPYLRAVFGIAGIRDISFVNAQPMDFAPGITKANLEKATEEARILAQNFVI